MYKKGYDANDVRHRVRNYLSKTENKDHLNPAHPEKELLLLAKEVGACATCSHGTAMVTEAELADRIYQTMQADATIEIANKTSTLAAVSVISAIVAVIAAAAAWYKIAIVLS